MVRLSLECWQKAANCHYELILQTQKVTAQAGYLKGIKFRSRYSQFVTIFAKFCTGKKFQNLQIEKLNTHWIKYLPSWDSLFPNIWSKYDTDIGILHISIYGIEIRVSVTYLIPITLISNRNIDIQWDFCFLFLVKSRN